MAEIMLADAGYFSEANVTVCAPAGIESLIALSREGHHSSLSARFAAALPTPAKPNAC